MGLSMIEELSNQNPYEPDHARMILRRLWAPLDRT